MMMMMMMMIIKMGQSYQVIIVVQLFERWDDGSTDTKQRIIIIKINYVAGFFQFILEIKNSFIQVFNVGLAFVLWLKLNHCERKIYKKPSPKLDEHGFAIIIKMTRCTTR